jgi:predicted dehydrogenase
MTWISVPEVAHYQEQLRFVSPERRVTLTFPSPYLRHAPTPLSIERMDDGDHVEERHTVSYEEAFRSELHHFREAVLNGTPASPGVDEALGDARWIEMIAKALIRDQKQLRT